MRPRIILLLSCVLSVVAGCDERPADRNGTNEGGRSASSPRSTRPVESAPTVAASAPEVSLTYEGILVFAMQAPSIGVAAPDPVAERREARKPENSPLRLQVKEIEYKLHVTTKSKFVNLELGSDRGVVFAFGIPYRVVGRLDGNIIHVSTIELIKPVPKEYAGKGSGVLTIFLQE